MFLAWSNNGLNWHRPLERKPLIPNGPDGGPDDGFLVCAVSPPIRHENELWLYYTANPHPHIYPFREPGEPTFRVGRIRVDGWAGYQAGSREGMLETRPFIAEGTLRINADCMKGESRIEVHEVVDARPGQPLRTRVISGFAKEDCEQFSGDEVQSTVRWKSASWEQIRGKSVVLRVFLRNATLYSFETVGSERK